LLKIIVKKPASVKKVPASLREDIVKLDWIIAQTRFLGANKIETAQDLQSKQKEIQVQMEKLTQQRRDLRTALKRALRQNDPAQVDALKAQIAALSAEVRKHRKEVKLCDDIAQRNGIVLETLKEITRQKNTQGKENKQHEYDQRRGRTSRANVPGGR
jgi:phage I-like protein